MNEKIQSKKQTHKQNKQNKQKQTNKTKQKKERKKRRKHCLNLKQTIFNVNKNEKLV